MSSAPIVVARSLGKDFRDFWGRPKARAVNGIDLEIRPGEVVGLLGPNGSGKSTTVKLLLGLLYPTSGQISVFGASPRAVETKKRIGYLPEETYLYPYLTAEETLDFFGALFHLSTADRKNRIAQLLDMVGLAHAARRQVGEFSKGMARRIGIAQAMINDPDFLILDEPTSGLDPIGCREVKDLILMLKKRGKTVLVTSHLLSDVEDICDRVIILYGGKIRSEGELADLLAERDRTRITLPGLAETEQKKLLDLLHRELPGVDYTIDHPRRSLEDFFLEVVNTARTQQLATSGAATGGQIAEYLRTDEAVLSDLLQETAPTPPGAPEPEPEEKLDEAEEKLRDLEPPLPAQVPPPPENFAEAEDKLRSLLGKNAEGAEK